MVKRSKKYDAKIIVVLGIILAVVIVAIVVALMNMEGTEAKAEVITKSTLEKIVNVSELSTFEAVYNGVAKIMNEKKEEKVDYYVSYEAKVKAGIDFQKIDYDNDEESKVIYITLPPITMSEPTVKIETLEFIFENDKANTESVIQEAYKYCIDDAKNECKDNEAIYEYAEKNAKNVIEALIKPFISQLDADYKIEFRTEETK